MSTKELIVKALRSTLEYPLSMGQVPKDCAANARLLAELTGDLGKHSKPPTDADQPAHEMTREHLEELAQQANIDPPRRKRGRSRKG